MKKLSKYLLFMIFSCVCIFSFAACNSDNSDNTDKITDWGEWVVISTPSCTDDGVEMRASQSNFAIFETRTYATALGHDWDEWVLTTAPTCKTDGVETKFCKHDCEHKQTRSVSALGHSWGEWVMTTPPSETNEGIETRVCRHDSAHTETRIFDGIGLEFTEGLSFTLFNDGTEYRVSMGTANSSIILIPTYYDGKPVTQIGNSGFSYDDNIASVIFASNSLIESIASSAFMSCENLANIELPKSLKSIGQAAFSSCKNLETITIPASVATIGSSAFSYCSKLKTIYVEVTKEVATERWGAIWGSGEYNTGSDIATIVYLDD